MKFVWLRHSAIALVSFAIFTATAFATDTWGKNGDFPVSGKAVDVVRGTFTTYNPVSVVTINDNGTVTCLTSNGDVSFNRKDSPGVAGATQLVAGDFNKDGKLDIAVVAPSNPNGNIAILLGNGDGSFQSPHYGKISYTPTSLAAADFNNDGQLDLAIGSADKGGDGLFHNRITVAFGNGSGGYGSSVITSDVGHKPDSGERQYLLSKIVAGDFNADGKYDVAFITEHGGFDVEMGSIDMVKGNGDGTFTAAYDYALSVPREIKAEDINQDGLLDLVITFNGCHSPCSGVNLYRNNGNGTFTQQYTAFAGQVLWTVQSTEVEDLNNDGRKDIVISGTQDYGDGSGPAIIGWSYQNSDGTWAAPLYQAIGTAGAGPAMRYIIQGDFSNDGRLDIAGINAASGAMDFYYHDISIPPCAWTVQGPTVAVCKPTSGAIVASPVDFLAFASPAGKPVTGMKIYVDGTSKFTTVEDHISTLIPISNGTHKVTVKAWNVSGPYSTSFNIDVQSTSCPVPTTYNTVNLCSPKSGATYSSPVRVLASIQGDSNAYPQQSIKAVKIYVDGVAKYTYGPSTQQVDQTISFSAGSHKVTVKAWDYGTRVWSSSATFTVQ